MKKVTHKDLEQILGFEIDPEVKNRINGFNLQYRELTKDERDDYLLNVFNVLSNDITKAGDHRIIEWEEGWSENLIKFKETKNINDLIPRYHSKNRIVKWNGDVVLPLTDNFDYKIHICFVDAILRYFLTDVTNIFEFGCGPAYHLVRMNEFNSKLNLYGSDWTTTSQKIIREINGVLNTNINGFNMNFFKPDYSIEIPKNSGIYTIAALEQIGENYVDLVDFLIDKKPKICVHMEPIDELLDNNLMGALSRKYFRKRNYLNGYLPYLEELESEGKIEIIVKQRTYSGSYFIEGHSLIVWRPLY